MKRVIKAQYIPDLTERYPEGFSYSYEPDFGYEPGPGPEDFEQTDDDWTVQEWADYYSRILEGVYDKVLLEDYMNLEDSSILTPGSEYNRARGYEQALAAEMTKRGL